MAIGGATFTDIGGAFSDLFAGQANAEADNIRAQSDFAEAEEYDIAGELTKVSTNVQEAQQQRAFAQTQGNTQNEIASAGFSNSGSALDIMRSNAEQGSLSQQMIQQQGLATEQSYATMAAAAETAGTEEEAMAKSATTDSYITAGIKGAAAVATLLL